MSRFRPSRNYVSGKVVFDGGPVDISGDLVVSGSITANEYNVNVINTNVTHIDADGNTKFGDTPDDTHQFTGSVFINGPLSASSIVGGGLTTPGAPDTSVQYNDGGAFAGDANFVWDNAASALTVTGDITSSANVSGAFFYGDGSGLTGITATAAPAGSNTQIQYNADGAAGADADFTWASGSNILNVSGYISASAISVSSSNPAETLLNVSGYNFPNLLNVDASSSLDGGARVMIRNSNDDIVDPSTATIPRGVLHLEQDSTSSVAINSNGISLWTNADENYESTIRLHTWNPNPGNGSAIYFYTNEGAVPGGFVASGQTLGRINFGGQATTQTELGYFFQARASQTWNGSSVNSSYLQFYSVPPGLGAGLNIKERIRFTGEGHIIVFPYEASNSDAEILANNFDASTGAPALQVYGPTLFGSSSANTHIFTGSVIFEGDLSASLNISASAFYGNGANLTDLNASNISAGTLDNSHLPATISVTNITASTLVSASAFYGDGSNLTNLPAGSPAGINTQVQFNADGAFGADNALTWASGSNTLTVSGTAEVNELQLDTAHVATGHTTGRLYWDDDAKTITADMQGSDVRLQIGQEEHIYVQNASGVDIDNGDAVRIAGAAGVNIQVEKAISEIRPFTSPVEQDSILGIATEDIPDNQFGYVTVFGQVRDLNTSAFATGDILYLSHTTSGSYTNVKPPAPYFDARVGIVEVVNATTGVILSRPSEPIFLTDIASITSSNVPVGVPSYLCYNDTTNIANFTNELSGAFSGSYQGDGSLLESLNASNISAGTLDNARLPTTISVTNVTASALVSSSFFYGDGSNLTNLPSAAITTYNNPTDNYIVTAVNATTVQGEANLQFDGTTLAITGDISGSGNISGSFFYGDGSNLTNVNAPLLTGKSLFVDSVNGDDGTGTRGNESLPYLTIGAAITDSLSGDAIYVGPGDYPESGLSLPTGRALIGAAGYTRTSLGITSSAADILATVDDTWVEGLTFNVPTGSGNAGIRYTGSGGTMQAYSLAYAGDGASGLGDGFVKTGTGKVIGAEVRLSLGGLNSVVRVDQGVVAFESIHIPNATGVVENVAYAEGTGRFQLINFNAGNPNVVNTLSLSGSAVAVCLNVNWFNIQNGLNLLQDGVSVEINGGKIEPSAYTVKMDLGVTWTSVTSIDIVNSNILPLFFFPPSGLDTQFEAFYSQKKGENYLGAARLLGVDFISGFPEKGSGIMAGRGGSYGENIKVYTSDGTDTSTTVGVVTDVSTTASSLADSTFTFEGGAVDHCIYYGSIRKTSDGELVKNFGTLIDATVGSLTGAYAFEIWDGSAWKDIDYMCTSLAEGYRYANNPFMRSSSKEFVRLGTTPSTVWATSSVDSIDAYWTRCRITTSASLPTFERWWLTPSHFMVSSEGVRQSHGSAAWKETLVGAGNIFGESGGVVTADIDVGSGVVPDAWTHNMPNSLLNQNSDAVYTQFALPAGINTSFPLTFKVLYSLDSSTGVTTFPTGILSAIPLEVTGIEVADPAGGKIPTARQFDSTEALTSKAAPLAQSLSMQPEGSTAGDDLSDRIFSIEYSSLSIEEYYEDDIIAIRFELDDDGDPAYNVAIWAIIVEGHKFTEGKAI